MSSKSSVTTRSLDDYLALMDAFVSGQIGADAFERRYLEWFQDDEAFRPPVVFAALDDVFWAVDSYVADPALQGPEDLNEDQLRSRVRVARRLLQPLASTA